MRWHGYRPANKRYVVFQTLGHALGVKPEIWRVLDKCHGRRDSFEYDGAFDVDERLLADLIQRSRVVGLGDWKAWPNRQIAALVYGRTQNSISSVYRPPVKRSTV